MYYFIFCLFLIILFIYSPINCQIQTSEFANFQNEVAEDIANRTYAQEQTNLQKYIFKKYDRKIRPVRNQSKPTTVLFHAYLMHFSIDQFQQTMFLNGHIYMTWTDELATWDPSLFNNVRTTMVKNWEIWQPELRIANSVSGVNQYFEISRRSHATLTSLTPNRTKVESYPTFSVRVGCNFDFSDYPNDEQNCAARLYTTNVMSEVELSIYYNLVPSVMLGWGNQSIKKNIQEWELLSVDANLSFYKSHRKYSNERPSTAYEAQSTWTLILLSLKFRRNSPQFWLGIGLPCFVSLIIILLSFLSIRIELSIGLLLTNFVLESVLLRDALQTLPPAAGETPRIVTFAQLLLITTLISLIIQIFSKCFVQKLIKYSFFQKLLIIPQNEETNKWAKFKKNLEPELIFRLWCLFILFLISIPCIFIFLF